ncbi:hypothetical protein [Salinibacter altiplanensis]|uniref:hypothetical protein n=1 Tax=Salinibacter altiplanensis TaxID=1803181 RepID=UPI000C9F8E41|nr:hypothetical protein [Salinibacter altiplanensis]
MNAHLAVVGHRSSHPVHGADRSPLDLTDTALPTSVHGAEARRLFRALDDARREMRVRQAQSPADAKSPLRLGLVVTGENGTALDVHTASTNLRTVDLDDAGDREAVLGELRDLEREFLAGG